MKTRIKWYDMGSLISDPIKCRASLVCFSLGFLLISGCKDRVGLAPVEELQWHQVNKYERRHTVLRGETLYAVAFRYDTDYRQLALTNHLRPPYTLRVGQVLQLQASSGAVGKTYTQTTYSKPYQWQTTPRRTEPASRQKQSGWLWPAQGRLATSFVPQQGKKGIDIAGRRGEKIHAAAEGTVAYAGNGLAGYGNLIIIKHDNQYLTAYGYNLKNLVTEGQRIRAGQIIADMGVVDRRFWGVHFEMRKSGKPVNPMYYLKK